jgi:hypothetical protein
MSNRMRAETVQLEEPRLRVVQWARWGGVGLLFYAAALALDNFGFYTDEGGGAWVLLWVMLPYVAIASVLIFSRERAEPSNGPAPMLVAGAIAAASLALALRVMLADEPLMGPIFEPGVWSAMEIMANVGLPFAVLLVLLTAPGRGIGRLMPLVAIGVGVAVTAGAWAVAVRDLSDISRSGTWNTVQAFLPSSTFGFLLIVAGAYLWESRRARTIALILAGVLAVDAAAMVMNWATSDFRFSGWMLTTNLTIRASYLLVVLAFGGVLTRTIGFASASVCLVAAVVAAVGTTMELDNETANWLWFSSFGVVTVISLALLALVTVEVQDDVGEGTEAGG